jgi:GH18 family chitinase
LYEKKWSKRKWLSEQRSPYVCSSQNEMAFYEDMDSVAVKAAYAKSVDLGGVAAWSMDMDDFSGQFCMQGNFPLITLAKHILNSYY